MTNIHPKLQSLPYRDARGQTLWKVLEAVRVKLAPRWYVEVPEGFVSNLGSIPRYAKWLVSSDDFPGPFVLHDYMCGEDSWEDGIERPSYTRWQADSTLYHTLTTMENPPPAWKAWVVWFAVRAYARWKGLR
jgi:hypothetical protein